MLITDARYPRRTISAIAARFYPRQPETIAAVTGTSGKTSTAQFAREIWQGLGYKSASIGTLGLVMADEARYGSLTTPDAITLHRCSMKSPVKASRIWRWKRRATASA